MGILNSSVRSKSIAIPFINGESSRDLENGDVVVIDTTTSRTVKLCSSNNSELVMGVVESDGVVAQNEMVFVIVHGIATFKADGTISASDTLISSNTSNYGKAKTSASGHIIGRAISDSSGGYVEGVVFSSIISASDAHSSLSGLTTGDDHTQYLKISGRTGGQTISDSLTISYGEADSTALIISHSAISGDAYGIQIYSGGIEETNPTNTYGLYITSQAQNNSYGIYASVSGTTNNYGFYADVTGGVNNYAAYFNTGNVVLPSLDSRIGIASPSPRAQLHIGGGSLGIEPFFTSITESLLSTGILIRPSSGTGLMVIEGTSSSSLVMSDYAADSSENKFIQLILDNSGITDGLGRTRFRTLKNDGYTNNVDNIFAIQHSTGHILINPKQPSISSFSTGNIFEVRCAEVDSTCILATNTKTSSTDNYGFYSEVSGATNNYGIYCVATTGNAWAGILEGNLGLGSVSSLSTVASATNFLVIENGTQPIAGTAAANSISISSKDASSTNKATISIRTEEEPESTSTFTQSHRLKIWVNGVEYWIPLDNV